MIFHVVIIIFQRVRKTKQKIMRKTCPHCYIYQKKKKNPLMVLNFSTKLILVQTEINSNVRAEKIVHRRLFFIIIFHSHFVHHCASAIRLVWYILTKEWYKKVLTEVEQSYKIKLKIRWSNSEVPINNKKKGNARVSFQSHY